MKTGRLLLAVPPGLLCFAPVRAAEKPNFIYIMADELGYFKLGFMGGRNTQAPNIDRMAADGSSGQSMIVVDVKREVARFYCGDHGFGVAAISSGTEMRATPAGDYKILERDIDHASSKYGVIEDRAGNTVNADATPGTGRCPRAAATSRHRCPISCG